MRSLFTFLLLCFYLSVATAQTTTERKTATTTKKPAPAAKKATTTAAQKPVVTQPRPATVATAVAQPVASTLTFPSTEPENVTTLDEARKQQMYDELHGIKPQSTAPAIRRGQNRQGTSSGMATRPNTRAGISSGEAGTYIGVRAGGNFTTLLEQPFGVTIDPWYGFHAGLVFQFGRGGVAFQPEVNYNQDYFSVGQTSISAASLVVPLLAKFQFGQQGNTRFFINLGPYGALPLNSGNSETVIDYGAALGLGVGIPAGSGKFTIEARSYYQLGSTASGSEFGNVTGKPLIGQLSLGYLFPIGSR